MHTINTHEAYYEKKEGKSAWWNFLFENTWKEKGFPLLFFLHIQDLGNKNVIKKFRKLSFYICILHLSNQIEALIWNRRRILDYQQIFS